MKIEEYKNQKVTLEDISYLEKIWNGDKNGIIVELNKVYPLFDDLIIDKFDRLSFLKLRTICYEITKYYKDKKAFEISLKLIYQLISYGEESKSKVDYAIESAIAGLYDILAELIYDGDINFIPYSLIAEDYNIDKDTELALDYFKKAYLHDPLDKSIASSLAYHYCSVDDIYKAYAFYPRYNDDFYFGKQDVMAYTTLGCKFNEEFDKGNIMVDKIIFDCFFNAYEISKECNDLDDDGMFSVYYNMAYCYIKGIYVKKNINKGKKYLQKLDSYLIKKGKGIMSFDDPDGIIKDYYLNKSLLHYIEVIDIVNNMKIDKNKIFIDNKHRKVTIDNNRIVVCEENKGFIEAYCQVDGKTKQTVIKTKEELINYIKTNL